MSKLCMHADGKFDMQAARTSALIDFIVRTVTGKN